MTGVKMKVVDQLHLSSIGPDSLGPGDEFHCSAAIADDLEQRGLATRARDDAPTAAATHPEPVTELVVEPPAPAPENKGEVQVETKPAKRTPRDK